MNYQSKLVVVVAFSSRARIFNQDYTGRNKLHRLIHKLFAVKGADTLDFTTHESQRARFCVREPLLTRYSLRVHASVQDYSHGRSN